MGFCCNHWSKYVGLFKVPISHISLSLLLKTFPRQKSYVQATHDLTQQCDPATFERTFGAPVSSLDQLVESKVTTMIKSFNEALTI
jgi:hypothetical protein